MAKENDVVMAEMPFSENRAQLPNQTQQSDVPIDPVIPQPSSSMSVASETTSMSEENSIDAIFLSNKGKKKVIYFQGYKYTHEKTYKNIEYYLRKVSATFF